MASASELDPVSTRCQRIAELARQSPQMGFTSLAHHIDSRWLYEAYCRTRADGATGVDGQTAADYAAHLGDNLRSLLERAKSGTYRAPPVRRVHIPKGTGPETRPIGIPTFEDKVLQRAVAMVLEAVYEQDFLPCSYGFRPGRSAHQALDALWRQTMGMGGGWVVEVDIRKFFDTLDHAQLRELLRRRIRDGVLLRLIGKWLNAGVLEDGQVSYPSEGTPQGGVISPLLANVYLHHVLDEWFEREVKPRLQGRAFLIRYADDFVIGFACEADARRVLDVLPKRFGKYGLTLHPDKTRLVAFRPPGPCPGTGPSAGPQPGTFDLLGFTHYWARSRQGNWVVKRRTAASRFRRALRMIAQWCRLHRHVPIPEQHRTLSQKLRGHCAYYGITGNGEALRHFRDAVQRIWQKWLSRRSWAGRLSWDAFNALRQRYPLPRALAVHSEPVPNGNACTVLAGVQLAAAYISWMSRKPYPSDVTDDQWALLEARIPPARPGGAPRKANMREVVNALFYRNREGCTWRALPHDFPPWKTVYNYYQWWQWDGTWDALLAALREQVRTAAGREATPRVAVLDSQSAKTTPAGGPHGYDGAKKVTGRKRHIAVDTLGLLLAVAVTAADVPDAVAAQAVLEQLPRESFPRLRVARADSAYGKYGLPAWVQRCTRFVLELVRRPANAVGWLLLPKRWVVERTFAWLGRYRIHSRDYERLTAHSETQVKISAIHMLLRRATGTKSPYAFRYPKRSRKRAA